MKRPWMRGPLWNSINRRIAAENPDNDVTYTSLFKEGTDEYLARLTDDMNDAEVAIAAVAHAAAMHLVTTIVPSLYADGEMKCESPIERLMYLGLVMEAITRGHVVHVPFRRRGEREVSYGPPNLYTPPDGDDYASGRLVIDPQVPIGEYRVDFVVSMTTEEQFEDRTGRPKFLPVTHMVLVECDGHDFHERTKEQAARDRKRDRILQSVGYRVLRFTGSEIYKDVLGCVDEVLDLFDNWPDDKEQIMGEEEV